MLALALSASLSLATYELARSYLLDQRTSLATRQVMVNALVSKGLVAASAADGADLLDSLRNGSNARAVLRVQGAWYSVVVDLSEASLPAGFVEAVDEHGSAQQVATVGGAPYLVYGIQLPGLQSAYFEFVPLAEYESTLKTLGTVLIVAASVTTVGGALGGWRASRRVLRPLGQVAEAANAMSSGDLSRRLTVGPDPDLEPVANSFNEMASSLQQRIERELRFTADVSHELRTPLTAMAAAIGLARRVELPDRASFAVDVLDAQVDHLRRLTLELLEISRIDAGVADLRVEETNIEELVSRGLVSAKLPRSVLRSSLGSDVIHHVDPTRFDRVVANLLENAARYGGGATAVHLWREGGDLILVVDDEGPGVDPSDRAAIFGRFNRGSAEQPDDLPKGTGLGLALVEEHVKLHAGTVAVATSPGGGARFIVRIPRTESEAR